MLSISVIVLLSSVAWACAEDFTDNLAFGDKLADRALIASSLQHGLLEDTINAKPGTKIAGGKPAVLNSEPTSPCKSPFKVPLVQSPRLRSRPLPSTPGATVDQVELPNPGLLERLASIAGLSPVPRQKVETRLISDDVDAAIASAKEGSRYFGRLAPLPGVLPEMMTPNEAASISIAGNKDAEEERENQEQEGATSLSRSTDDPLRWRLVLSPKKSKFVPVVVKQPRSTMDTDIDSRRKMLLKHPRSKSSGSHGGVPSK